jgi:hypothetical protein
MKRFMGRIGVSLFLSFVLTSSAFAKGGEVGNGGDVFQCQNSKSVLVDIYEAQAERGIKLDLGGPRLDLFSKIDLAIKRLERLSPIRAKMYHDQAHNFFNEASLIPNAELAPIEDVYNWATPDGCVLKQIAVQHVPQFPLDKRYLVSKDLWDTLDEDSKAALILHEVIYREGISLGFTNSVSVRYLNSLIFSHELDKVTPTDFATTLQEIPFVDYQVGNVAIPLGSVTGGVMIIPTTFQSDDQGNIVQAIITVPAVKVPLSTGISIFNIGRFNLDFSSAGQLIEAEGGILPLTSANISGNIFISNENWTRIESPLMSLISAGNVMIPANGGIWLSAAEIKPEDLNSAGLFFHDMEVISANPSETFPFQMQPMSGKMFAQFNTDGTLKDLTAPSGINITDYKNSAGEVTVSSVSFANQAYVSEFTNLSRDFYTGNFTSDTGVRLGFLAGTNLEFWPSIDARPKTGTLAVTINLPTAEGGFREFNTGTVVHFDQSGYASLTPQ